MAPFGQKILDILRATPADDVVEELALLAFTYECEARRYEEAFKAAVGALHEARLDHDDARQRLRAVLYDRRRSAA